VQTDLLDLHDSPVFFRGDGSSEGSHEDLGKKIVTAVVNGASSSWDAKLKTLFFRYGVYPLRVFILAALLG
jgi:hypothetical protein